MLDGFSIREDESKRQLYVAMTRAKNNLSIHYNNTFLDDIYTDNLIVLNDDNKYSRPETITVQLSHKDVWLGSMNQNQQTIANLNSGDELIVDLKGCKTKEGRDVLMFSKQFIANMEIMIKNDYLPRRAQALFIVYWSGDEAEYSTRIVLPEICFEERKLKKILKTKKGNKN